MLGVPDPHGPARDTGPDTGSAADVDTSPAADAAGLDTASGVVEAGPAAEPRHRVRGGALALGMLALDQALGRKVREEAPIVVAANDDPIDIDRHGITVGVDDSTSVVAPPQPRPDPYAPRRRRRRRPS